MVPAPIPWGQFLVFIMVSIVESTFESTVEPAALHNIPKANPQYCGALRHWSLHYAVEPLVKSYSTLEPATQSSVLYAIQRTLWLCRSRVTHYRLRRKERVQKGGKERKECSKIGSKEQDIEKRISRSIRWTLKGFRNQVWRIMIASKWKKSVDGNPTSWRGVSFYENISSMPRCSRILAYIASHMNISRHHIFSQSRASWSFDFDIWAFIHTRAVIPNATNNVYIYFLINTDS